MDVSYTDESGLYELVDAAQDRLLDLELTQDKLVMRRFMKELVTEKGLAAYGESEVRHNLELGSVEVLLLSEDLRKTRTKIDCTNRSCDFSEKQTRTSASSLPGNCLKCGSALAVTEERISSLISPSWRTRAALRSKSSPPSSRRGHSSSRPSAALRQS